MICYVLMCDWTVKYKISNRNNNKIIFQYLHRFIIIIIIINYMVYILNNLYTKNGNKKWDGIELF